MTNAAAGVQQSNQYYPFGMLFAETVGSDKQDYKYNGKELDQMHGLNHYDYSARQYDPARLQFTTMDPLSEKFYSWSPYVYCYNNPINAIDPDGRQGFLITNSPILGTNNPVVPLGRTVTMLSTADKIVQTGAKTNRHHVIPRQIKANEVIRSAREAGFKFEGKENKITLEQYSKITGQGRHATHPRYTEAVAQRLASFKKESPNFTPKQALEFVRKEVSEIIKIIQENSNTKINDLTLSNANGLITTVVDEEKETELNENENNAAAEVQKEEKGKETRLEAELRMLSTS